MKTKLLIALVVQLVISTFVNFKYTLADEHDHKVRIFKLKNKKNFKIF